MQIEVMDSQAFEDALDRFGGDLAHWPAGLRAAAERLLAASPEARELKVEMETVEACLRATPPKPAAFNDMAAVAMRLRQVRAPRSFARQAAAWGAATVAALVLGIAIGNVQYVGKAQYEGHDDAPDQVVARALGMPGATDVD